MRVERLLDRGARVQLAVFAPPARYGIAGGGLIVRCEPGGGPAPGARGEPPQVSDICQESVGGSGSDVLALSARPEAAVCPSCSAVYKRDVRL